MADIEKAKVMLWTALGLTGASVVTAVTVAWGVRDFIDKERAIQAQRFDSVTSSMGAMRDGMAEVRGAVNVQAEAIRSMRSEFNVRFDAITREQDRLRDDLRTMGKAPDDGNK